MGGWVLAVDVGAMYVSAAVRVGGQVEVVRFGGADVLPALVYFGAGEQPLTGGQARERALADPNHAIWSPRQSLAQSDEVTLAGDVVPLARVYATILSAVVKEAAQGRDQAAPERLVIAFPASWAGREYQVIRSAAELAGLSAPEIMSEPVAAARHLAAGTSPGEFVAILDVGSARVEAAVLRRTPVGFEFGTAPSGVSWPAGGDAEVILRHGIDALVTMITSASARPDQLSAVYVLGRGGPAALATALATQILGVEPVQPPDQATAIVRGALAADLARPPASQEPSPPVVTGPPSVTSPPVQSGPPVRPANRSWSRAVLATVALCAVIAIAAGVVIGLELTGRGGSTSGAGTSASGSNGGTATPASGPVKITITQHTISKSSGPAAADKLMADYPVISGLPNTAIEQRINAALSQPATKAIASFGGSAASCPTGNCAFLALKDTVYQAGKLLSVKYYSETHFAGAGDINYELQAVTIRTDTGAALPPSTILTSAALASSGRDQLAGDLQAQHGISSCDEATGWRGESGISPALATISSSREAAVIVNVTTAGLQFSFGEDVISPTACAPVGVVPDSELSGLISPSVQTLAGSQK